MPWHSCHSFAPIQCNLGPVSGQIRSHHWRRGCLLVWTEASSVDASPLVLPEGHSCTVRWCYGLAASLRERGQPLETVTWTGLPFQLLSKHFSCNAFCLLEGMSSLGRAGWENTGCSKHAAMAYVRIKLQSRDKENALLTS